MIIDDDAAFVVLSIDTGAMAESGGMILVTLFTTGDIISDTGIIVTLEYTGVALYGADYTSGYINATIPAGMTGISFTLTGIDDLTIEGDELVTIDIASVLNGSEYGTQTQNLTIIDDDTAYIVLSVDTGAINESAGQATFIAEISGGALSSTGIVVTLIYSGTATNGVDYLTGINPVTIPAGQTGVSFTVDSIDDLIVEGDETVSLEISGVVNAFEYGTQVQNVTILDDDTITVLISVNTGAINEFTGAGLNVATVTLYTSGDITSLTGIVADMYYTGIAINGVDYLTGPASVTIPAGLTGISFTITPIDDQFFENGNEDFNLNITGVLNASGYDAAAQNIIIIDDETTPVVFLTGGTSIGEATGVDTLRLYVTSGIIFFDPILVELGYVGVALSGTDYTGSVFFTILPSETGINVDIASINDLIVEGNEDYIVGITSVTGSEASISPLSYIVSGTIVDDDIFEVVLTADTGAMDEANGAINFRLASTGGITSTTGVIVTLSNTGSATDGLDFTTGTWTYTIPAGDTGINFTLTGLDDLLVEGIETLDIEIS